ncbi:hypothetical protein IPG41_00860 [Candidatus Peregrinibacteria bacterium]|nr:MAG: hypothetical protein IPG41_00860 [Candidatus Peregrinibacteria bacterium]
MKNKTFFKSTPFLATLFLLLLLASNGLTAWAVYSVKESEYNELKLRIASTIDQKLKVQDELEELRLICPVEETEE